MTSEKIRVGHGELERFVTEVFRAKGMSAADAATVAEVLVWANLRGVDSHGVARLPRYVEFIDEGATDPAARPQVEGDTRATFVLAAARAAGPVAMMQGIAAAVERATATGISLGLVRGTTHTGAIGRYAQWAAERGFAAIIASAGNILNMAYHGARVASLATSPLAIAVPGGEGGALVLDLATSIAAFGRIVQAREAGTAIPEDWALDETGQPTTDPRDATISLPLGGHKGSGLSLMFELLAGLLTGNPVLAKAIAEGGRGRHVQNAMIIAINVAAFRPLAEYRQDVAVLAGTLRGLPLRQGFDEILLPGERGDRTAALRRRSGIPIRPRMWSALNEIADVLRVAMPRPTPDLG